jgi:hypothetical protein
MPERPVGVTDVAAGAGVAEYRTRERTVGADSVVEQYLLSGAERVPSFVGMTADFWSGNAISGTKTSLSNLAGSDVLVAVRSVWVPFVPMTVALTTVVDLKLYKQNATGSAGNVLSKQSVGTGADVAETSSASVEIRSRHSADGAGAFAITLTLGAVVSAVTLARPHSLSNHFHAAPYDHARGTEGNGAELILDRPEILRPGQSLAVHSAAAAANVANFTPTWLWEEYLLP